MEPPPIATQQSAFTLSRHLPGRAGRFDRHMHHRSGEIPAAERPRAAARLFGASALLRSRKNEGARRPEAAHFLASRSKAPAPKITREAG